MADMISFLPILASAGTGATLPLQLDELRAGDVVDARVDSVGDSGLTRLNLNGAAIDVRSSSPLIPGTRVRLIVEKAVDGSLLLQLRRPTSCPLSAPGQPPDQSILAGIRGRDLLGSLIRLSLAPAAALSFQRSVGHSSTAPEGTDNLSPQGASETAADHSSVDTQSLATPTGDRTAEPANAAANRAIPTLHLGTASTGSQAMVVNFMLPGTAARAEIAIFRDDEEPRSQRRETTPGGVMTVKISLNSDALGPIHAFLRQSDGVVSVRLWCERPGVAAAFAKDQSELRDEFAKADVLIDALEIIAGSPPN